MLVNHVGVWNANDNKKGYNMANKLEVAGKTRWDLDVSKFTY